MNEIPKRDFIEACYGRPVQRRPIWIMRQAGRYQASYRAVRARHSFEELCSTPELAAKVTLQPIEEFDLDAAILFSDILTILPPMGLPVSFGNGGPKIAEPIRRADQVEHLFPLDPHEGVSFVLEAVKRIRRSLPGHIPLIGFAGAPFTLSCYAIEGTTSREFAVARRFFFREPEAAQSLMQKMAEAVAGYLNAQIDAGANAVQIFDSWGGLLSAADYRAWVFPHLKELVAKVKRPGIPVILYVNGSSHLLEVLSDTGCDVISVDWRTVLTTAAEQCKTQTALQGNLDPLSLYSYKDDIRGRARAIMAEMDKTGKGHIFNLGHGILPTTPEENVKALVETVHSTPPVNVA
ncbi:MAG: uroporphyrinogen decarboxylase [Candidatus Zixiibacteriota bacterium]